MIESNEAFAAQACAVARALDFDPEKVNPNGSGISSATQSVPPERSSPPRPSMSCNAPRAATPWPPCASAAAKASPLSSSASEEPEREHSTHRRDRRRHHGQRYRPGVRGGRLPVLLIDVSQAALERGVATLGKNLERQVNKGTLEADKAEAAKTRIRTSTDYADLGSAQLVIEAATENLELKQRILKQVAANVASDCLIATNTSSLSVTALAASIEHPERFIGVHFFNPVPMMALVEIIRGLQTSDSTYAQALVVTENWARRRSPPATARASWSTASWCR